MRFFRKNEEKIHKKWVHLRHKIIQLIKSNQNKRRKLKLKSIFSKLNQKVKKFPIFRAKFKNQINFLINIVLWNHFKPEVISIGSSHLIFIEIDIIGKGFLTRCVPNGGTEVIAADFKANRVFLETSRDIHLNN